MFTTPGIANAIMHPLTLSFSADLEPTFRDDYCRKYLPQMRLALTLGALFYAVFGILDLLAMPEVRGSAWSIRGAVIAFVLACVGVSLAPFGRRWMQLLAFLSALAGGLGGVALVRVAPPLLDYAYAASLTLVLIFNYSIIRLRFLWATIAGWLIVVAFGLIALGLTTIPSQVIFATSFVLVGANVAGMIAGYTAERHARRDFYLARMLQEERENVQRAHDGLGDLVAARTAELKDANVALRQEMEARSRLFQKYQRLAIAFDQASEGIVIWDHQNGVSYINPAMERISGYRVEEMVGKPIEIIRSFRHPIEFYAGLAQTIHEGRPWKGRIVNRRKDGTMFTSDVSVSPIRGDGGAVVEFVSVHRDVTRELQLEEQYLQAQKMEALGQLTSGIAHDFNNLLTAINGFASLMELQLPEGDPSREFVNRILGSGQRAAILIRQLLAFSRKQAPERQPLDLNTIVSNLLDMLRRIIGEHITMHTELAPDLPAVSADTSQLEQVIVNLVVNARDAMPHGGELTISTGTFTMDAPFVAANEGAHAGDYVELRVRDTGDGISPSVQEHMFEPFFTTKAVGKGTGLGLATVFGIVKQYAGYITFDSAVGEGTTFRIFLPAAGQEKAVVEAKPAAAENAPTAMGTILVVEDNEAVRELSARALKAIGYTIVTATDGADATRVADDFTGSVDLLLTDVKMPFLNGPQLAARLKSRRPSLKVLYMTGYADDNVLPGDVLAAESDVILKPFTPQVLVDRVRAAMER